MLIVLCGKTCSGKDTICQELVKKGFSKIVTYTSRPPRQGEVNGYTYHFITDEEFHKKIKEGFFLEYKSYTVADGSVWYYGSPKEEFYSDENSVIILTPDGYEDFLKLNIPHKSIYIYANINTIKERLISRGDDKAEAQRRIEHDNQDFKGLEYKVNDIVYNNKGEDINNVVNKIIEKIA